MALKGIWLKAWHDLRARRAAVLVIFGTVAVVAALLTVAVAMSVNGFTFFDRLHAETDGADIWLQMHVGEIGWVEDGRLDLPEGTRLTDSYPMLQVQLEDNKEISPLAIAFPTGEQPEFGRLRIIDGEYLSADDPFGVIMDRGMALDLGFEIGDEVVLRNGDVTVTATVRGTNADTIHLPHPNWSPKLVTKQPVYDA